MSPAIACKLNLADRAQAHADEAAELRTQLVVTRDALQGVVDVLREVGGYMAPEHQLKLRAAVAALGEPMPTEGEAQP